jgi:hypothetical protein
MPKQPRPRTWDEILSDLRRLQFDVQDVPGGANQRRVGKHGCAIVLEKAPNEGPRAAVRPGVVIGGEIAQLVDRGFQKFFQTSKAELPATATLYNEALGTTSDAYLYDRVKGRDLPESERPVPAWDRPQGR